jgi:GAF domain-containing protein
MRATTVRFSEDQWELLEREARRQGVSTAQLVRDAAVLRVGFLMGRRGDPEAEATLASLAAAATADASRARAAAVPAAVRDPARLRALRATGLLDAPADPAFDRLAALAARLLDAPVALVSFVDADRQVFGACPGLAAPWDERGETPLSHSVCQHVVDRRATVAIGDARAEPLLEGNLAVPDLDVVAYLGAPLVLDDGAAIGSLCVIDHRPRHWTGDQVALLEDLAASVVSEVRLRGRAAG